MAGPSLLQVIVQHLVGLFPNTNKLKKKKFCSREPKQKSKPEDLLQYQLFLANDVCVKSYVGGHFFLRIDVALFQRARVRYFVLYLILKQNLAG